MIECNGIPSPTNIIVPVVSYAQVNPPKREYNYASMVGIVLYFDTNYCPNIVFDDHQCSRFTHNTRDFHEEEVLRICRYMKGTENTVLIFWPNKALNVHLYMNADFSKLRGHENPQDPFCAKSRTGYFITMSRCSLTFVFKLYTGISSSNLDAEYVALSHSLRRFFEGGIWKFILY